MDFSKSWDRFLEKYDKELVKHIRSAERGTTQDLSEYESEWIRQDVDIDPERAEAKKNFEGVLKSISEASKSMSQRSGHRFTEPEIAVRYIIHLKQRVESRTQNRDARWDERVWAPSLEKAIFRAEIVAIWADVALKLVERFNLDSPGFENQPDALALLIGEKGMAKRYSRADEAGKEEIRREIEEEANTFIADIVDYLQEERQRSEKIIEDGEEKLPEACTSLEELKKRNPKLHSVIKNRGGSEDDAGLGVM